MVVNGIDVSGLEIETDQLIIPEMVPGRTVHIDGDMLAYECSCFEDEPFARMKEKYRNQLDTRKALAGAEFVHVHLTGGNKGGRYALARVKEYQAGRKGKAKPKHLDALKAYVAEFSFTTMHTDQEADDGMAQANYAAIKAGTPDLSVIMSGDKDLTMCSGWHCNYTTFEMKYVEGFGYTEIVEMGNKTTTKVVKGFGTKFFWTQLLMGDTADSIPGLFKYVNPKTGKLKACGPVAAFDLLADCENDFQCLQRVTGLYREAYAALHELDDPSASFPVTGWDGTEHELTATQILYEMAVLLWMRRVVDEDVATFFEQVVQGKEWHE